MNDLVDEREVAQLARQYGPMERRHYVLEVEERVFTHWREERGDSRREVALFILRPSGNVILDA